jgi:DNA-binding transcriptional ArsR family regulator
MVRLLEADEELARRIPVSERAVADRHLVVPVVRVPEGRWDGGAHVGRPPFSYLVLEGTLLRSCRVAGRWSSEILGGEDILRPWDEAEGVTVQAEWQALEYVQLAIIEQRLLLAASRWPDLFDELLARSVRRSRFLTVIRCISAIRRLDIRLLVLLRLLAGRWGRVSPTGVHVGVRLTHEALSRIVGAQRPSVSATLSRLREDGLVRSEGRELVLALDLPGEVEEALAEFA